MNEARPTSPSQSVETLSPVPSSPKPQERSLGRYVRKCFVGRGGIRAGWRLLIFLGIAFLLLAGMILITRATHQPVPSQSTLEPRTLLSNDMVAFLIVLVAGWVMSRIERRRIADYGLPLRLAIRREFWQGIAIGFAAITALLLSMRLIGIFAFGTIDVHGFELFKYAALWAVAFLFVGLFEEFFFRGYLLFTLTTGITFWPSAILLSVFFGFIHHGNSGESWVGALEAGTTGLLFCFLLRRTGHLWMPIGFHVAWNWGETYFYGVPDSGYAAKGHLMNPTFCGPAWLTGGSAGPEGSWLCIALLVILWIIFSIWLRENKYPNPDAIRWPRAFIRESVPPAP